VTEGLELDLKILFKDFGINAKIKTRGLVTFINIVTTPEVANAHFSGLIVDIAFGVNSPITTIRIVVINEAIKIAVAEFSPMIFIARLVPIVATVIFSKLPINKIVAKKSSKFSCILDINFALLLPSWDRCFIRILFTAIMLASDALTSALNNRSMNIIMSELYNLKFNYEV
jgi:hypothetical protein